MIVVQTTHNAWDDIATFSFFVEAGAESSVYFMPTIGLEILSVRADGADVSPSSHNDEFSEIDISRVAVSGGKFVYTVPLDDFVFVATMDDDDDGIDLVKYVLPRSAARLEITYRPRYAADRVGPEMVLVSTHEDSRLFVGDGE